MSGNIFICSSVLAAPSNYAGPSKLHRAIEAEVLYVHFVQALIHSCMMRRRPVSKPTPLICVISQYVSSMIPISESSSTPYPHSLPPSLAFDMRDMPVCTKTKQKKTPVGAGKRQIFMFVITRRARWLSLQQNSSTPKKLISGVQKNNKQQTTQHPYHLSFRTPYPPASQHWSEAQVLAHLRLH